MSKHGWGSPKQNGGILLLILWLGHDLSCEPNVNPMDASQGQKKTHVTRGPNITQWISLEETIDFGMKYGGLSGCPLPFFPEANPLNQCNYNYSRHQMSGLGTRFPSVPWPVRKFLYSFDVALVAGLVVVWVMVKTLPLKTVTYQVDHPSMAPQSQGGNGTSNHSWYQNGAFHKSYFRATSDKSPGPQARLDTDRNTKKY